MVARRKVVRREWSKGDVRELKAMAGKMPARVIGRKLKRSEGAIRQKARALGTSLGARKRSRGK